MTSYFPIPLACRSLHAAYPGQKRAALAGIDLEVHAGEVVGILGPNGAGKTTLLRCVLGLLPSSQGEVRIFGEVGSRPGPGLAKVQASASRAGLARLGVLLESPGLYRKLTSEEYLRFFASLQMAGYPAKPGQPELSPVDLGERISSLAEKFAFTLDAKPCGLLSQGNKQKLHLLRSLLHDPDLLLWDEPTDHLDPQAQDLALAWMAGHARQAGKAALLASHRIEHLERVCDRVYILADGRIRKSGRLVDLLNRNLGAEIAWEEKAWPGQAIAELGIGEWVRPLGSGGLPPGAGGGLTLHRDAPAGTPDVVSALCRSGYRILQVNPLRPTLSSLYGEALSLGDGEGQSRLEDGPVEVGAAVAAIKTVASLAAIAPESRSISWTHGWRQIAGLELRLIGREPRFFLPFVLTSLFLVGMQAVVFSQGIGSGSGPGDKQALFLLAQPILLLLGVVGPALCIPLAADAFAGEKERHTLEILLSAPITPAAIFLGKVAGLLPFPIAFAWFGQGLLLFSLHFQGIPLRDQGIPLILALLSAPVLAAILGALGITLSLRSQTVRAATQSSAPLLLLAFIAIPWAAPWLFLHPGWWSLALMGLSLAAMGMLRLGLAR